VGQSDRVLADAEAVLRRHSERGQSLSARARSRRNAGLLRKVKWAIAACILIVAGAAVTGAIAPIGIGGVMAVVGIMLAAILLIAWLPAERTIEARSLVQADLKALPLQTEIWLEGQRKALPAPAIKLVDSIGTRLELLAPQLDKLNPQEPAALEVRRLLSDHLPELVSGYRSIPEPMRREERNGRVPEQQLVEGLSVIDAEIDRMTEQLASGDLDKLATHNRFLELKYQEARELGNTSS
jgi:hypothetical protein